MSKYVNPKQAGVAASTPDALAPFTTTKEPAFTHEGGIGVKQTPEGEFAKLAVSLLIGKPTFYENAGDREKRLIKLVGEVDPAFLADFLPKLRHEYHIRIAAVVGAAEYVAHGYPNAAEVVEKTLHRLDEAREIVGYYQWKYKRSLPGALKRGVARFLARRTNEYAAMKYAGWSTQVALADVVQLTHPKPRAEWQSELFSYLLAKRQWPEVGHEVRGELLGKLRARQDLLERPESDLRERLLTGTLAADLQAAGATWEWVAGVLLQGGMNAAEWEAIIPNMGVFALLRNLRNFDRAEISEAVQLEVARRIGNETAVRNAQILPFRFATAYFAVDEASRWAAPLQRGLEASLANVPHFPGKSLILVDVSGSMTTFAYWYPDAEAPPIRFGQERGDDKWVPATLFATAIARASDESAMYAFSTRMEHVTPGDFFRTVERVRQLPNFGGGTNLRQALKEAWSHHRDAHRIIVITDEQAHPGPNLDKEMGGIPLFTWNVGGYAPAWAEPAPNRYTIGGLSDAGFQLIAAIENLTGDLAVA